ncbi:MAG: ArsR/SmtB family transcription factor [Planctomycetota bacterium]
MARSKQNIPGELMGEAAEIMKCIAHPIRLRILEILEKTDEMNVTTLCEKVGASQPVVSQQLSRMRMGGVLASRRDGTSVFYRVARPEVLGVLECIRKMGGRRRGKGESR